MKTFLQVCCWAMLFPLLLHSQNPPKYEMRGVWLTTVYGSDFPNAKLDGKQQAEQLRKIIRQHKAQGFNTIFFQVRSTSDAFYQSNYEPWSAFLTGTQGKMPSPFYDPLQVAIEECHQNGMELHAWINPYRAVLNVEKDLLDKKHIARQHPEWIITYAKKGIINPGIPDARKFVVTVVMDIAKRYDIDGIHFDDYFYPYQVQGEIFDDEKAFKTYNPLNLPKADWRRANVDSLVKNIHDSLQLTKPWIKFGISPGGVWRNQSDDPRGSATRAGQPTYDYLFADPLKWLQEGWIDYIAPQVYWSIGFEVADFEVITKWWTQNTYGRHLYIGHGLYKVVEDTKDARWQDPSEIPKQVRLVRSLSATGGSIFFRGNYLMMNAKGVTDSLSQNFYQYPALPPKMLWKDSIPPLPLPLVNATKDVEGVLLSWEGATEQEANYIVYRFEKGQEIDIQNPINILTIQRDDFFLDKTGVSGKDYVYLVTVTDRLYNESQAIGKRVFAYGKDWEDSTNIMDWKTTP